MRRWSLLAPTPGVKGILCEKPFARTLAEADAMMDACDRNGVKVAVAHRRASAYEQHAKKLVDEGAIGESQVLRGHGKADRRAGAMDLMVLGTHMMDSMRYVAGADVAWAHGHVTQDGRAVTPADIREGDEGVGLLAGNGVEGVLCLLKTASPPTMNHTEGNPPTTIRAAAGLDLRFTAPRELSRYETPPCGGDVPSTLTVCGFRRRGNGNASFWTSGRNDQMAQVGQSKNRCISAIR